MKKSFSKLGKGISLALAVIMLLSMTAFADTATNTADTATYTYIKDGTIYKSNSTHNYQFVWSGRALSDLYTYAQGGLLLELPVKDMNIPEEVKADNVSSAELKLTIRYTNASNITSGDSNEMNDATRILFLNVTKAEKAAIDTGIAKAVEAGKTGLFYEDEAVADFAPQSLKNYIADGLKSSYPRDEYTNGYLNKSVKYTRGTVLANDETGLHYELTFDVTDLIKDGSLTEERYLLLQRGLYFKEGNTQFNAAKSYYVPASNYPPVLTVNYTVPNDATKVVSHKSKNDEAGAPVTFASDYAYTVTFDGDVDTDTLTEENVILTDSDGTVIDLDGSVDEEAEVNCITWDAETKTVSIPLPACDTTVKKGQGVKWLISGETYTLTLKKDIKNSAGNAIFTEEDWTATFTMEDRAYGITKISIRAGATQDEAKQTKNQKTALNVGDVGTKAGEWMYAYSYFANYTADAAELIGLLTVYNEKGVLVHCTMYTPKVMGGELGLPCPGFQLTQDFKAGYTVKSYLWANDGLKGLRSTSAGENGGALAEIVIGPEAVTE